MLYNFSFTLSMVGENGWTESLSQRKMKKGSQSLFQRVIGCWHLVALRNIATKHVQQQCTAPPSHAFTSQFQCAPVTHACILFWWPIMALYMLNFCWYLEWKAEGKGAVRDWFHSTFCLTEAEESASSSFPLKIFINGLAAPWLRPL